MPQADAPIQTVMVFGDGMQIARLADCGRLRMNKRRAQLPNRSNRYQRKYYQRLLIDLQPRSNFRVSFAAGF